MIVSNSQPNEIDVRELPYLLFSVGGNIYGISSEFVQSIKQMGEVLSISKSEPCLRGGTVYHDSFIDLIDMRKMLGMDSQLDEFEKTVQPEQRIKDHENWVLALEKSVKDHTEFMLTDDPHKCALGRWYYSLKTDNNILKHQLHALEAPHEAVHHTAKLVKDLMRDGDYEAAIETIRDMQSTHYKTTLHILSSLREIVRDSMKELYIVIDSGNGIKGVIVDSIVGVEFIETTLPVPESMQDEKYIQCLGRRKCDESVIVILNNSF